MPNPITLHHTWNILDSTKMMDFMVCARKYFYRYVLGYTSTYPNINLIFGSSWHIAKEVLLKEGYNEESLKKAITLFEEDFSQYFSPITYLDKAPKNPAHAEEALKTYIAQYGPQDNFTNIITEVGIPVPIDEDKTIYAKLDSINQTAEGKYFSLEHKTAGQETAWFYDQWIQRFQIGTYLHVLYGLYGIENVLSLIIDATIFRKMDSKGKGIQHIRIPLIKDRDQMEDWRLQAVYYYNEIMREYEAFAEDSDDTKMMYSFPKRTANCIQYNKICPHHTECSAWVNPLQKCNLIPENTKIEFWDPRQTEEEGGQVKNIYDPESKQFKEVDHGRQDDAGRSREGHETSRQGEAEEVDKGNQPQPSPQGNGGTGGEQENKPSFNIPKFRSGEGSSQS